MGQQRDSPPQISTVFLEGTGEASPGDPHNVVHQPKWGAGDVIPGHSGGVPAGHGGDGGEWRSWNVEDVSCLGSSVRPQCVVDTERTIGCKL